MTSKGLRDTTIEDFGGNNGPQAIGLKTDYYDRAMDLASRLRQARFRVEYAGHSLGGGLATSMSAVTGEPATTFNAANLHPNTVARYVSEHPEATPHHLRNIVTTYHVQDELLNPVVQDGIRGMSEPAREKAARMLTELANATEDPAVRRLMDKALPADLPRAARESLYDFLDEVAKRGHAEEALRDIPRPVSTPILLDGVKTRQFGLTGPLVDRADPMPLRDVLALAAPLVEAADAITRAAQAGRMTGEVLAIGGKTTAHSADATGDVVRVTTEKAADFSNVVTTVSSASARAGLHVAGESLARGREVAGKAEAAIDTVQGETQARGAAAGAAALRGLSDVGLLPDGLQRWAGRTADRLQEAGEAARRHNLAEAAEARHDAREDATMIREATQAQDVELERIVVVGKRLQQDVIAGTGERIDQGLDTVASRIEQAADRAPQYGAAGGAQGFITAATNPLNPFTYTTLATLVASGRAAHAAGPPAGQEIFERHLMTEAVVPSMEFRSEVQERNARALLESLRPDLERQSPQPKAESPSRRIELETPQAHHVRQQEPRRAVDHGLAAQREHERGEPGGPGRSPSPEMTPAREAREPAIGTPVVRLSSPAGRDTDASTERERTPVVPAEAVPATPTAADPVLAHRAVSREDSDDERQHGRAPVQASADPASTPAAAAPSVPLVTQPAHPAHTMYAQALNALRTSPNIPAGTFTQHQEDTLAAGLVAQALSQPDRFPKPQVDAVVMNNDGTKLIAVHGPLDSPVNRLAPVDIQQSLSVASIEQTSDVSRVAMQSLQQQQEQAQSQAETMDVDVVGSCGPVMRIGARTQAPAAAPDGGGGDGGG